MSYGGGVVALGCRHDQGPWGGLARLLLRATMGSTMIAHGIRHGRTLPGTAGWFGSIGFRQPTLQAVTSAVVEVGAGAALRPGPRPRWRRPRWSARWPSPATPCTGPTASSSSSEGYEYAGNLAAASVALAALGPGRLSVDRALGLDEWGTGSPPGRAGRRAGTGRGRGPPGRVLAGAGYS